MSEFCLKIRSCYYNQIKREISIMKLVRHPCVVRLYEVKVPSKVCILFFFTFLHFMEVLILLLLVWF